MTLHTSTPPSYRYAPAQTAFHALNQPYDRPIGRWRRLAYLSRFGFFTISVFNVVLGLSLALEVLLPRTHVLTVEMLDSGFVPIGGILPYLAFTNPISEKTILQTIANTNLAHIEQKEINE
jgi:hypothetical protein